MGMSYSRAGCAVLGKRMVDLALERIVHPDLPPQEVTIPTELVIRASCAAPRSRENRPVTAG